MAAGDIAAAAGMAIYDGNEDARDLWMRDNEVLDQVATDRTAQRSIARGGTGAGNAADARVALDVAARVHTHLISDVYALDGVTPYAAALQSVLNAMQADTQARVHRGGDTMSGNLFLPAATGAVTGYAVAYLDFQGRVCRGVSAARYKKHIHDAPDLGDLFAAPLREWQLRANGITPADPTWRIGPIADELVGTDLDRFVVRDASGDVDSIDFLALLMAQTWTLNARELELEQRVDELERKIELLLETMTGESA